MLIIFFSLVTRTQIFAFQFATELLFISLAPFGWQFFLILALKIALNVLAKGRLLEKLNLRLDHWLERERVYRWPYAFQYGFKMNEWVEGCTACRLSCFGCAKVCMYTCKCAHLPWCTVSCMGVCTGLCISSIPAVSIGSRSSGVSSRKHAQIT